MPTIGRSLSIAVTGLQAAERRLAASASNVVNARSATPAPVPPVARAAAPEGAFRSLETVQTALPGGGVRAEIRPRDPGFEITPDPDSETGFSSVPDVDFAEEMIDQTLALASYRAAAAVIRTADDMDRTLLDIKA